jgi:hypothetical protein
MKYAWALQLLVLFVPNNYFPEIQMLVAYGFFFDFFLLNLQNNKEGCSIKSSDIALRFFTNLVHHYSLLSSSSEFERMAYGVCWMAHLFPWFHLFSLPRVFKYVLIAGNFTPAIALVWLVFSGTTHITSVHGLVVLIQMTVYRGIYVNATHSVLSNIRLVSKEYERDRIKVWGKRLLYLATILAIVCLAAPNKGIILVRDG